LLHIARERLHSSTLCRKHIQNRLPDEAGAAGHSDFHNSTM
jgi:hypothetical protein